MMRLIGLMVGLLICALPVGAQELSALARLDRAGSYVRDEGAGVAVGLALSQPVPWRVVLLDQPPRLLLDFREVDFGGAAADLSQAKAVVAVRSGVLRPGWSRLVLELAGPMVVQSAAMETGAGAMVRLSLVPAGQAAFAAAVGRSDVAGWDLGPRQGWRGPSGARPGPHRWWWCWIRGMAALIRGPSGMD